MIDTNDHDGTRLAPSRLARKILKRRVVENRGEIERLVKLQGAMERALAAWETLPDLESRLGLKIVSKWTERTPPGKSFLPYQLKVTGFDRPGIVHQVTELIAKLEINVATLDSRIAFAPLSGTPMFVLEAHLQIPTQAALRQLRRDLSATCDEIDLDFALTPLG